MSTCLKRSFAILFAVVFTVSTFALPARFDQPNMEKAKKNLKEAKNHLNNATADKGGHRNKAIDLVNAAITAVENGIEYDRTHNGNNPRRNSTDDNFDVDATPASDQPNMVKARQSLQNAIADLNRATADKGGFRNRAIGLARDAIAEVNAGIEFDRRH